MTAARERRSGVRVTHVVFDFHGGGMETLVTAMARGYHGTCITTSLVTLSGRLGNAGAAIRPYVEQLHVLRPLPVVSMAAPVGLARALRRTRADVVHLHNGAWFKGAFAARLAGVQRVVYTEHGREHRDGPSDRWIDRRALPLTDLIVPVSERLRRYMHERLRTPLERMVVVPNGVDVRRYSPGVPSAGLRARLDIPADARVLGSTGRLVGVKAYERLVEAFASLSRRDFGRPLYLVICGEGEERGALEALAERLGVANRVRLPGWADSTVDYYRFFDIFALTSRSEGASLSLMEAMACGAVPVVMDVGANAEILGRDLAPLVAPAGDVPAFTERVARLLASPERMEALSGVARGRVLESYDFAGLLDSYARLYAARSSERRPVRAAL